MIFVRGEREQFGERGHCFGVGGQKTWIVSFYSNKTINNIVGIFCALKFLFFALQRLKLIVVSNFTS